MEGLGNSLPVQGIQRVGILKISVMTLPVHCVAVMSSSSRHDVAKSINARNVISQVSIRPSMNNAKNVEDVCCRKETENSASCVTKKQERKSVNKTSAIGKFYYFFPQAVALVGVRKNVMPAAWHTPISAKPPLYGILISPKRYTFELLQKEDGFTINFLEHTYAALMAKTGSTSGRDINKCKEFGIETAPAEKVNGPILPDSYAAYECEKYAVAEYGDHSLFVGKIIMLHYREEMTTQDRLIDCQKVQSLLYFGQDRYVTIDPHSLCIFERK